MKYKTSSTRWQAIVYEYENAYPVEDKIEEATPIVSTKGIVSINIGRSKSTVQNTAQIEMVGPLPSQYVIGNWMIIKSKKGTFKTPTEISPISEGVVRFIGQIMDINTSYLVAANGLRHKRASIIVREWSSVLHCPVRLEMGAAEQSVISSGNSAGQTLISKKQGESEGAQDLNQFIVDISQNNYDPFDYVRVVLSFIGMVSGGYSGTPPSFSTEQNSKVVEFAKNYSKSAMYMPHIPQSLLDYLGMSDIEPDSAFSSNGGFVGLVLGVKDKNVSTNAAYSKTTPEKDKEMNKKDNNSFNGVFSSFESIQSQYKNYKDRPVTTGMATDFSQGIGAWDIIKGRCDPEYNECFTDIWYCRESKTPPKKYVSENKYSLGIKTSTPDFEESTGEPMYAKPVIVLRDKPFALKKYIRQANIKDTNWSSLDDVPRVWIDDIYIRGLSNKSSFYESANYIQPSISNDSVKDTFYAKNILLAYALRTVRPEMNRFGGIKHFPSTPFIGINGKIESLSQKWFAEATKIQYLWHALIYRFGSGSISIKDSDIPIMVGCNISFPFGEAVLCAHVESVSWSFMVNADGSITNECNISYSHLCKVLPDSSLDFLTAYEMNHLMETVEGEETISVIQDIKGVDEMLAKNDENSEKIEESKKD